MNDVESQSNPGHEEIGSPDYASFILRCWANKGQPVRVRLVDVNSGVSHPVADLNTLPDLLRRLIREQRLDKE